MLRTSSRRSLGDMCSEFLDAATAIGHRIAAEAIWHDGRCSWVGVSADPHDPWQAEYRALEPDFYGGTAGVGLFLAHVAAPTGHDALRRTAVGAMRHAAAGAAAIEREGFHAGPRGIAWAVARAAELLDDDELDARARRLVTVSHPVPSECSDVVQGTAGSAIASLALAERLDDASLLDDAVAAGERLLEAAVLTSHGWSWPRAGRRYRRHLCGLSHGAAGIGWALVELFAATGDDRFRAGAEGAFAYERSWLHEESGTWPDLRIGGQRRGARRPLTSPAAGTWCHGEGGIALTRLRVAQVLGPEPYEREAALALETTRRLLAAALPYEIDDLTLCQGAYRDADVLLCGERSEEAVELGHAALERYAASGQWPCGPLGGTTPALFRGLSGIGWWFLRLHDRTVPSPLALPTRLTASVSTA